MIEALVKTGSAKEVPDGGVRGNAQKPAAHDLVEVAAEQFIVRHIRATMRPSWAHEAERMVRKEIIGPWKGRRLSEIGKTEIHTLLDAIEDRPAPVLAEKVFKTLRRFYSWAIERGVVDASPCVNIKRARAEKSRPAAKGWAFLFVNLGPTHSADFAEPGASQNEQPEHERQVAGSNPAGVARYYKELARDDFVLGSE
jgi:hypothetical protein